MLQGVFDQSTYLAGRSLCSVCVVYRIWLVCTIRDAMAWFTCCLVNADDWMTASWLWLNPAKSQVLWFLLQVPDRAGRHLTSVGVIIRGQCRRHCAQPGCDNRQ